MRISDWSSDVCSSDLLRNAVPTYSFDWREALTTAWTSAQRPVVLADTGDNPGGGAMIDATFVLRALIDEHIGNAALGFFWELGAVHLCRSAGVGAALDLRLGVNAGTRPGDPGYSREIGHEARRE